MIMPIDSQYPSPPPLTRHRMTVLPFCPSPVTSQRPRLMKGFDSRVSPSSGSNSISRTCFTRIRHSSILLGRHLKLIEGYKKRYKRPGNTVRCDIVISKSGYDYGHRIIDGNADPKKRNCSNMSVGNSLAN